MFNRWLLSFIPSSNPKHQFLIRWKWDSTIKYLTNLTFHPKSNLWPLLTSVTGSWSEQNLMCLNVYSSRRSDYAPPPPAALLTQHSANVFSPLRAIAEEMTYSALNTQSSPVRPVSHIKISRLDSNFNSGFNWLLTNKERDKNWSTAFTVFEWQVILT